MKTTDLKLFSTFTDSRSRLFEKSMFYVYYIGNPLSYANEHANNLVQVPIYIAEINNDTDLFKSTHVFSVDWSFINCFSIGQYILQDGRFRRIEHIDESFRTSIHKRKLYIPDPTNFQVRTMSDFIRDTDGCFFKYLSKVSSIQKELIYTYTDHEGKKLHIPAMEALRHFYVDSKSDTFMDHVLLADAMTRGTLYKELIPTIIPPDYDEAYSLELAQNCQKVDAEKLFYFLYENRFKMLFSDVWMQWTKKGIISAPIPAAKTLKINVRYYENKHGRLVFNIFQSSLINYDKSIVVNAQHPNDYIENEDHDNRNPDYDKNRGVSDPSGKIDVKKKANKGHEAFHIFREENLFDGDFVPKGLSLVYTPVGKQKDRGGRVNTYAVSDNGLTLLSDHRPGGDGTKLEIDEGKPTTPPSEPIPAPLSSKNDIGLIADHIRKAGHTVEGPRSYYFKVPECTKQKKKPGVVSQPCNKAEAYLDFAAKTKRTYTVFKVLASTGETFFCLDVDPKTERKHLLVLYSVQAFDIYVNEVIEDLVFKQVLEKNHLWLRHGIPPKYTTDFKRIPHIGDAESMANKILNILPKTSLT